VNNISKDEVLKQSKRLTLRGFQLINATKYKIFIIRIISQVYAKNSNQDDAHFILLK